MFNYLTLLHNVKNVNFFSFLVSRFSFLACLMLSNLGLLKSQALQCGTPDIPLAVMQQILDTLPQQASSSGSSPIRIPIYYFLLRGDGGSTIHGQHDIEESINIVNFHFDGLFEFYVCGQAQIDDDRFAEMDLNSSSSDVTDLQTYVNLNYPLAQNCIKVFFSDLIELGGEFYGGYAFSRFEYDIDGAVFCVTPLLLSHELGHYFGLPHTFVDSPTQYVHDLIDPLNHPVLINGIQYTCKNTGDGFCDTPADRYPECSVSSSDCIQVTCTTTDPLGLTYGPDPTLLMSYHNSCINRFSLEQSERMKTLYEFLGQFAALRNIAPDCALKTGQILRHCSKSGNSFPDPFEDVTVTLKQTNNTCLTETNGGGRYIFNPCNWGNDKRSVLPDLNFSNPDNGVTTFDLVLMSKHILGLEPFTDPYTMIAADANRSGSITTFDIVETRKVILGINSNFSGNVSWRYIPNLCTGNQSFLNQFNDNNPFDALFTDPFNGSIRRYNCSNPQPAIPNNCTWMDHVSIVPNDPLAQIENSWSFTGIKVGDVNCTATSDELVSDPDELFFLSETGTPLYIAQGQFKLISVIAESPDSVVAWQLGVSFSADSLDLHSFHQGDVATTFDLNNFHHIDGGGSESGTSKINALWFSLDGSTLEINDKVLFQFMVEANVSIPTLESFLHLNTPAATPVKFYNGAGEVIPVSLKLNAVNAVGARADGSVANLNPISNVQVAPVPFNDAIDFNFTLEQDAAVRVNLHHADGRLLASQNIWLTKGDQEVRFLGISNAPSGIYYYTLSSEGHTHRGVLSKK